MDGDYMYKIFIDTNIFLDFYRINDKNDINTLIVEMSKYKDSFINTEQSKDEFLRNREKAIDNFIVILNGQSNKPYNTFISTLPNYDQYKQSIKKANEAIDEVVKECLVVKDEIGKDPIYKMYKNICGLMFERTDEIIDRAIKRKYIGNPPYSDKYTCCDEIIWESLLANCKDDLIIVTRDKTFKENFSFLQAEYKNKNGKDLKVVQLISDAIRLNGEIPSEQMENTEMDLTLENNCNDYGNLDKSSTWANIIYYILEEFDGQATLNEIYEKAEKLVKVNFPEKSNNKDIPATIRGILQRYSSGSSHYNGKIDLFTLIGPGKWAIKDYSL